MRVPVPVISALSYPLTSEDAPPSKDSLVIAVKDNICTKDFVTTCASAMLQRLSYTCLYGSNPTHNTLERLPAAI